MGGFLEGGGTRITIRDDEDNASKFSLVHIFLLIYCVCHSYLIIIIDTLILQKCCIVWIDDGKGGRAPGSGKPKKPEPKKPEAKKGGGFKFPWDK